jgi:3-phosphoshikimate 1-carboxyvinyltransferase
MGAGIQVHEMASFGEEPVGDLVVEHRALRGVDIAPALASALIDEIPALAVAACGAEGETVIRGAAELRVKESDRLAALANGLRALGADVEELPDGLVVRGPSSLRGGEVDSYGDHRIAMAFQVVGLVADGPVRVRRDGSVETSFPGFGRVLAAARGQS